MPGKNVTIQTSNGQSYICRGKGKTIIASIDHKSISCHWIMTQSVSLNPGAVFFDVQFFNPMHRNETLGVHASSGVIPPNRLQLLFNYPHLRDDESNQWQYKNSLGEIYDSIGSFSISIPKYSLNTYHIVYTGGTSTEDFMALTYEEILYAHIDPLKMLFTIYDYPEKI